MIERLIKRSIQDPERTKDPRVREQYGLLSGGVGILLNLLLSGGKFCAGLLTGSVSITADAFNNLSDAGSSVVTLVGFRMAGQRADDEHPFGHGRIEYLAGLLVSLLILVVGVELGWSSIQKIVHPEAVRFSAVSVGILLVSIAVKLWMCRFNRYLSQKLESAAMAATALDSLSDAVATTAVLLAAVAGQFTSIPVDGWAGLLVSAFILRGGWQAARDTVDPLLGQSTDEALTEEIRSIVLSHPQVVGMHDLIIHDYGPGRTMMSFHAEVARDARLVEIHEAVDHIERELKDRLGIETVIHIDPVAADDAATDRCRALVEEAVRAVDPELTLHDFQCMACGDHTDVSFDVVAPHKLAMDDDTLTSMILQRIQAADPKCYAVIQIDRA